MTFFSRLDSLIQHYRKRKCTKCGCTPEDPAVCLVCGKFTCLQGNCCVDSTGDTPNFECIQVCHVTMTTYRFGVNFGENTWFIWPLSRLSSNHRVKTTDNKKKNEQRIANLYLAQCIYLQSTIESPSKGHLNCQVGLMLLLIDQQKASFLDLGYNY